MKAKKKNNSKIFRIKAKGGTQAQYLTLKLEFKIMAKAWKRYGVTMEVLGEDIKEPIYITPKNLSRW